MGIIQNSKFWLRDRGRGVYVILFDKRKGRSGVEQRKREREREKNENVCTEIFRLLNFVIRGKKLTGENGAVDVDERINKKKKKNYERVRESVNKRDTANEREKTNLRIMCIFFVKKKIDIQ